MYVYTVSPHWYLWPVEEMCPDQFAVFSRIWHQVPDDIIRPRAPYVWVKRPFAFRAQRVRSVVPPKEKLQHVFHESFIHGRVVGCDVMPAHQHPLHEDIRHAYIIE